MGKITQLGDFVVIFKNHYKTVILKNQIKNHCKTVILKIKIEIITNYEFLKSKSSLNQVILKIILKSLLNYEFFHYI